MSGGDDYEQDFVAAQQCGKMSRTTESLKHLVKGLAFDMISFRRRVSKIGDKKWSSKIRGYNFHKLIDWKVQPEHIYILGFTGNIPYYILHV